MKKISKKKLLIIMALWVAFLFGEYSFLAWGYSDHEFRYGDLNYWLLTDSEIRTLPIVGAKSKDVLYHTYYRDGFNPAGMSIIYPTWSDSPQILATLKAHFNKLGYLPETPQQSNNVSLQYQGKGYCEKIGILIQPGDKGAKTVRFDYIMKLVN